jgi:hypothetical protein
MTSSPGEASIPVGNGIELEKGENTKLEGSKGEIPREGGPSYG